MIGFVFCLTKYGKGEPILVRGAVHHKGEPILVWGAARFIAERGTDPMDMCNTYKLDTIYMWGTDPST